MAKKFYAVQKGTIPGIYNTWDEAKQQVDGYSGAVYKGFITLEEAQAFLEGDGYETKEPNEPTIPDNAYAFVDGSYNIETGVSGYGGFLVAPANGNNPRKPHIIQGIVEGEEFCKQRNVAGELSGVLKALEMAKKRGYTKLTIFYDYEGIEAWTTGKWKTNNKYTKNYKELVNAYMLTIDINFVHTKGHSGIEGNEKADRLAKEAVGLNISEVVDRLYENWYKK